VNQTHPSGLTVIRSGALFAVGTANSVKTPVVLRRATLFALRSQNQMLPSPAVAMPAGPELGVGSGENSATTEGTHRSSSATNARCDSGGVVRVSNRLAVTLLSRRNSDMSRLIMNLLGER
jgi:hypothetical protein